VHAQDPELLSPDGCALCHGSGESTQPEACFACHEPIREQLEQQRGWHGTQLAATGPPCGSCHIEHVGREFPLVGEHSFQLAGFAERAAFDHPFEGYALVGAHAEQECSACHANADVVRLEVGQRRFLGQSQECDACHDDSPHEVRMQRACEACHGQERPFDEHATFEHDERFPLEGVHGLEDCGACHERGGPHAFERLASLDSPPRVRSCDACHEPPHAPTFLGATADLVGQSGAVECSLCHLEGQATFGAARATFADELHAASGFALTSPHAALECDACHAAGPDWTGRFPGRERRDCAACHEDAHAGQFDGGPSAPACADCHGEETFVPARFDLEQHARSAFPLVASHRAVACYGCHGPLDPEGPARRWRGAPRECRACHEDGHEGRFDAQLAGDTDCAQCHAATRFADAGADRAFDHRRWTDFALEGAHAELECAACHRPSPRPDARGRRFGRIAEVFGALPTAERPCAGCHQDPHAVDFDAPGRPRERNGARGCARCHEVESWRNASAQGFEHETWTERRLGGAHLKLECVACHRRAPTPDALGRSFGRIRELFGQDIADCRTCHADPHLGLFDREHAPAQVEGRRACERCHGEQDFTALVLEPYDHDLWTGSATRSGHAAQTCDDCHPRLAVPGEAARGRRAAQGSRCVECHSDPHAGQFVVDGKSDCRTCHEDQASWSELVFDHARDSRYVLDGVHVELECSACHPAYPQRGQKPLVRYKPLGIECVDCHALKPGDPRR
jgi:hypothetical protein